MEKWIDLAKPTSDVLLKGAGSQQLRSYGKLRLMLKIEMHTITSVFEIADVRRTIFSVGVMEDHGWKIAFGSGRGAIERGTMKLSMRRQGRLYLLDGEVESVASVDSDFGVASVMPVENLSPDVEVVDKSLGETGAGGTTLEQVFAPGERAVTSRGSQAASSSQDAPQETPQKIQEVRIPPGPTPAEARVHALTHLPHREWCATCVKARGRDQGHAQADDVHRFTEKI